ncbi:MAG: DNA-binding protein [Campylobacterota bacterium]
MKTNRPKRLLTGEEARQTFVASGISIAHWAKRHGVSAKLVYEVLAGRTCRFGQSHKIAVLLHMKHGTLDAQPSQEPDFAAAAARLAHEDREAA